MPAATVRTSRSQTAASLAILALLAVIAGVILAAQGRFNPAVTQWRQTAASLAADQSSVPPARAESLIPLPEGFAAMTPAESFDPQTLSDKIDGKAGLYLAAGFVRLESQRFKGPDGDDSWQEFYKYDMGAFENAYSVFSVQRREDGVPLDLSEFAYRTENALFLVHGRYYVEIIASQATDPMQEAMRLLAGAFVRSTTVARQTGDERRLFPVEGLEADSIARIASDAFGYEGLDGVFTALYRLAGVEMTAFLSRRNSSDQAAALAAAYRKFLTDFGGQAVDAGLAMPNAGVVNIMDTYEIVFSVGLYVAGVREAADLDPARELAASLQRSIEEMGDGT